MGSSTCQSLRAATFSALRCLIDALRCSFSDVPDSIGFLSARGRHKALRLSFETIHGRSCRDVERTVIFVAPGQVCRLFGHDNRSQMIALGVPDPNALWSSDEQAAAFI